MFQSPQGLCGQTLSSPTHFRIKEPQAVEHSECGLTSAKQKWRNTFLNLLATSPKASHGNLSFLYCKGMVPPHVQLGVHQMARSFSAQLLSSWVIPSIYTATWNCSCSAAEICIFPWKFPCQVISVAWWGLSLEGNTTLWFIFPLFPVL